MGATTWTDSCRASTDPVVVRLWGKVEIGGPDECWEWRGARSGGGYGQLRVEGRTRNAHRLLVERTRGLSEGEVVRHSCDNPPCCNPRHLLVGSSADNARDMVERGRQHPNSIGALRGSNHGRAKLTEDGVRDLRRRYAAGESATVLATEYGIARVRVARIAAGREWSHVPLPPAPEPRHGPGLCECGCGRKAPIATMSNARLGHVKGEPIRFVHGHHMRRS